jgi:PAS domain S-box-containing protein
MAALRQATRAGERAQGFTLRMRRRRNRGAPDTTFDTGPATMATGQKRCPRTTPPGVMEVHISSKTEDRQRVLGQRRLKALAARRRVATSRASEVRFRRCFELGLIGMAITSPSKGWLEVNDEICQILGYPRDELLRRNWAELTYPDDLAGDLTRFDRVVAGEIDGYSMDKRWTRKDGQIVDSIISVKCVRREDGSIDYFVALVQDITARRRAEREAERAARLKDDFLSTLSHELRTPLNAILGWTHLIKRGIGDPERVRRGVEIIDRNARAQAQLIADLLDLSRIVTGKMRLRMERTELHAVVHAAVEAVGPAAEARGIHIRCALEPFDETVLGDEARLQQIVWNLLSNAVKFTPEGGRVRVALARVDDRAEITVTDTGRGIDPRFLPHLFERFRQADGSATREHGGLGIGLALVKQLTELHDGEVFATSGGEGTGSTFVVRLPLARLLLRDEEPCWPPHVAAAASGPVEPNGPRLEGLEVLVVDDEPDALEMMRGLLKEWGAEVTTASSADDALTLVSRAPFDLVLSDIGMPRRDGYELIAELRRRGVGTPAAAVTAFARAEDRDRALLSGYQAHLTKPVEPHTLLAVVVSLTGRSARRPEEASP